MLSVKGYFENDNTFVSIDNFSIPAGSQVIVTILDDAAKKLTTESDRQRKIFADFFSALNADTEELPSEFDEVISEGIEFREYDWS